LTALDRQKTSGPSIKEYSDNKSPINNIQVSLGFKWKEDATPHISMFVNNPTFHKRSEREGECDILHA